MPLLAKEGCPAYAFAPPSTLMPVPVICRAAGLARKATAAATSSSLPYWPSAVIAR